MDGRPSQFDRWPTGTKLLVIISAALLPLGLALAWAARDSIEDANRANRAAAVEQGRAVARAIESLIARNALALGVAANGALRNGDDPCAATARSLALTPAIARRFTIRRPDGDMVCIAGDLPARRNDLLVAPGDIRLWVSPLDEAIDYRVGIVGGMATGDLTVPALRGAAADVGEDIRELTISDGNNELAIIGPERRRAGADLLRATHTIGRGQLQVVTVVGVVRTTLFSSMAMLLPLLMWVAAAFLSWWLVRRSLIQPLGRLQRAVLAYQPGAGQLEMPDRLGPAAEIRELGNAFVRSVDRIEESERQMAEALEGQRRLVREVHHRVKNNLQVVASLLNIHGRSATSSEARAAYAAIGRRVDALSVVHRNHFAEVEASRGIALRPLLVELGATLRASAPEEARAVSIQLDVDPLFTTQDAAVATAFFVTEVVEFAMLQKAGESIEIELRRTSELAARLTIASNALMKAEGEDSRERDQFGRIIGGLARQLRSPLDEKIGRLSVDIPVFPEPAR
jgi:two-component system, sensor histidine kinase PdtaS